MIDKLKKQMHGYTVKKSKSMNGRDGIAWSCEIWKDKVKIVDAHNDGNGGMTDMWYSANADERKQFEEIAAIECGEFNFEQDGSFAALLADCQLSIASITRKCKANTLIQFEEDAEDDSYRVIKVPFTPQVANQIRNKYGAKLLYIINEQI